MSDNFKYFKVEEMIKSDIAEDFNIVNSPDQEIMDNIKETLGVLDRLREDYGKPIYINSGYRCKELNDMVYGSKTSSHLYGLAADMSVKGDIKKFYKFVCDWLDRNDVPFDQCIIEQNSRILWVHLGIRRRDGAQRRMKFNLNV